MVLHLNIPKSLSSKDGQDRPSGSGEEAFRNVIKCKFTDRQTDRKMAGDQKMTLPNVVSSQLI